MISFKKIVFVFIFLSVVFVIFEIVSVVTRDTSSQKTITIPTPTPVPVPLPEKNAIQPGGGGESPEFLQADLGFVEKHPVLQKLPVDSPYFDIEYINEQHLIIHAKTTEKERDYEESRKWFAENDIDMSKIIIEYE